jgi:hypothetical protein
MHHRPKWTGGGVPEPGARSATYGRRHATRPRCIAISEVEETPRRHPIESLYSIVVRGSDTNHTRAARVSTLVGEVGFEPTRPFGQRFFLPLRLSPPAHARRSWPGPSLHPRHDPFGCAPFGLYTFLRHCRRLGSGLACRFRRQPPPNLRRSTPGVSPGALKLDAHGMRPPRLPFRHSPVSSFQAGLSPRRQV